MDTRGPIPTSTTPTLTSKPIPTPTSTPPPSTPTTRTTTSTTPAPTAALIPTSTTPTLTPIVITPLVGCTTGTTQIDACNNFNGSGPFTTFYIATGTVQLGTVFFYDINATLPVYTADWVVTPAGDAVPVNTFDGQVLTNPPYFNC